jgi:hypothetical protein
VSEQTDRSPANAVRPSYELWASLGASLLPHALAIAFGGYGRIVTIVPLAAALTFVAVAANVVAFLQWRDDTAAFRSSHWLVWAVFGFASTWIVYAIYVGLVYLMVRIFCINQLCRGPLG